MTLRRAATLVLAFAAGCGGEAVSSLQVNLRMAQMQCEVPGLQAKLQIAGRMEECPLTVNADRTVSGVCAAVPAGQVLEFRLVYFILLADDPTPTVELATAIEQLDLTNVSGGEAPLSFSQESLNVSIDDDQDGQSNLAEVCSGQNPRG